MPHALNTPGLLDVVGLPVLLLNPFRLLAGLLAVVLAVGMLVFALRVGLALCPFPAERHVRRQNAAMNRRLRAAPPVVDLRALSPVPSAPPAWRDLEAAYAAPVDLGHRPDLTPGFDLGGGWTR